MWDVKVVNGFGCGSGYWFYLNYVGCKVGITMGFKNIIKGFTLTMWDVKSTLFRPSNFEAYVLP